MGSALERGLKNAGYDVRMTGSEAAQVRETAEWGEMIILAVPFGALDDVAGHAGDAVAGKTVIDVTNPLDDHMRPAVGHTTSAAEELQRMLPDARVVKAFNTVFAPLMDSGSVHDERITTFVAGDDEKAKADVLKLASDIGFDAVDAGPLANSRLIEPLASLVIQLGYGLKMGTQIGIKLVRD